MPHEKNGEKKIHIWRVDFKNRYVKSIYYDFTNGTPLYFKI